MKIDKIKEILSGYGSEKGFDFVISKVRELSKNKQLKENINELIKLELSAFEKADRDGEYDFPGLIDFLKEFGSESFIESYVYAYIESDSLENKKELIRKECIRDTKANTQESEQSVRRIVDRCFSIVDEHLLSCLSKEELIQARVIIKSIEEALKQQTESIEVILQTYLNKFTTLFSLHASSTTYHTSPSLSTDNQAYLDAFTNPLFLEDEENDENIITLSDMYISPYIQGSKTKASECIIKWYKNQRQKPCMILYGNAGVGKSSLISKILADAYDITKLNKKEFYLKPTEILAVSLRNHTDVMNIQLTAEEILMKLFSCKELDKLKHKLLILDGLDELCVLRRDFNGGIFLDKLAQLGYDFNVLITSRESDSYFMHPQNEIGLRTECLLWEKEQISEWIKLYSYKKAEKVKWCEKFMIQFNSISHSDPRRDIFCVPIILYICGYSELDLDNHNSVGSIYDNAFRKILLRKHIRGQDNITKLTEADKEENLTSWQYTKELAYQMFLLDTLDLVDSDVSNSNESIGLRNAKSRTKYLLKKWYNLKNVKLDIKKELAVCPFTKANGHGGITFAHKTVYEYFTAVKLYEDYFASFNTEYFQKETKSSAAKAVMECFIEAFRYAPIKKEIFDYLCDMNGEPFSATINYINNQTGLNYQMYEQAFEYGMQNHIYAKIGIESAVSEYLYPPNQKIKKEVDYWLAKAVNLQFSTAFANFTWFLTGHGFRNKHKIKECMNIGHFLHNTLCPACFKKWNLDDANLSGANLTCAIFSGASMQNADLSGSNLAYADLSGASMQNADLSEANLSHTKLSGSNLSDSRILYTDFSYAEYCLDSKFKTILPYDYLIDEYKMIEVDIS